MQKKYVVIAPVGDMVDNLFTGLKEFPTERIYLITPEKRLKEAEKTKKDLERFKIPTVIRKIKGNLYESFFVEVGEIKKLERTNELIINVSTGDRTTRCAATSAAFVNGLKAFAAEGDQTMLLPILKFSYYKLLTDKKMRILEIIAQDKTCCKSLEELSKKTKMSLPLISYHINGNLKSEGLKELGLVETSEKKGKIAVTLSSLGRLLLNGYIAQAE